MIRVASQTICMSDAVDNPDFCLGFYLGKVDYHVPVSPVNSFFLFDFLGARFDHEFVLYDLPVYSYHVRTSPGKNMIVFL